MLKIYGALHVVATLIISIFLFANQQILLGATSVVTIFTGYCFIVVDRHNDEVKRLESKYYSLQTKTSEKKMEEMEQEIFELKKKLYLLESIKQEKD